MKKLAPALFLIIILSGCAPHFYQAGILVLDSEGLEVVDYAPIEDCIKKKGFPKNYKLERQDYTLYFQVVALGVGIKIEGENFGFEKENLRETEIYSTIDQSYTHYFSTLEEKDTLRVDVTHHGTKIASEHIEITRKECKAVTIDAL